VSAARAVRGYAEVRQARADPHESQRDPVVPPTSTKLVDEASVVECAGLASPWEGPMSVDVDRFLETWRGAVAEGNVDALAALLAANATLGAPPYWTKFEGAPLVRFLLGLILETIDDFSYHREWRNGRDLALEFTGRVDGLDLQGIDLITLDDAGRVANLDVLMRPMNAVQALIARVAPQMQAHRSGAR
jgi:hypothetical protein